MEITFSAGGTPASVRQDIERSLGQQLGGRALTPGAPELAEAVRTYIGRQLEGVAGDAAVAVSASVVVWVSKPATSGEREAVAAEQMPDPAPASKAKGSPAPER